MLSDAFQSAEQRPVQVIGEAPEIGQIAWVLAAKTAMSMFKACKLQAVLATWPETRAIPLYVGILGPCVLGDESGHVLL